MPGDHEYFALRSRDRDDLPGTGELRCVLRSSAVWVGECMGTGPHVQHAPHGLAESGPAAEHGLGAESAEAGAEPPSGPAAEHGLGAKSAEAGAEPPSGPATGPGLGAELGPGAESGRGAPSPRIQHREPGVPRQRPSASRVATGGHGRWRLTRRAVIEAWGAGGVGVRAVLTSAELMAFLDTVLTEPDGDVRTDRVAAVRDPAVQDQAGIRR
jgi:hypothetical protein